MKIKIKIPASSANLGSGFDCLSVALNLYNFYEFETHTKEFTQSYTSEISPFSIKENLVEKAYLKNCKRYALEAIPFHLHCNVQIPLCYRPRLFCECSFSRSFCPKFH